MELFRIKKDKIWCFFLIFPFFEPQFFKTLNIVDTIYKFSIYFVFVYCIYKVVKKRNMTKNLIIILLLELWIVIITFINKGETNTAINFAITLVGLSAVICIYSKKAKRLLNCLLLNFEICIYANFITLLFLDKGLYWIESEAYGHGTAGFFLGWNHLFVVWEIPALMVAWINKELSGKNIRCYCISIIIILTELFYGASTGTIGVLLLCLMYAIPLFKKIITPYRGIMIAVLATLFIVVFRLYGVLQPVIVGILNKDMTFTGRLLVWDNAFKAISSKPLTGYGILEQKSIVKILGFGAASHCHNEVLQIIFVGGLAAFLLFVGLYYTSLRECVKFWKFRTAQICTYTIVVYTIIGITEQFEYALMYLVLILPFYLKNICFKEGIYEKK